MSLKRKTINALIVALSFSMGGCDNTQAASPQTDSPQTASPKAASPQLSAALSGDKGFCTDQWGFGHWCHKSTGKYDFHPSGTHAPCYTTCR